MKALSSLRLAAMAAWALPLLGQVSVIPLKQFSYSKALPATVGMATIAFDRDQVYVSSPDGVVMAGSSLASDLHPIFQSASGINRIYVYDRVLYVLTSPGDAASQQHAMFESKDQGETFAPIDDGLHECVGSYCYYLTAGQLFAENGLLFTNAGGGLNLLVSSDEGKTWIPLSGDGSGVACTNSPFAIVGRTVLQGGECPLDNAFLSRGMLGSNMQYFDSVPMPVQMPDASNRRINGIGNQPGTSVYLAGAEGALYRSVDDGRSWNAVIEEPAGTSFYPYIPLLQFSSRLPGVALAGGFNKSDMRPFLAILSDGGARWTDVSPVLGDIKDGLVTDLSEDPHGRLLAVVIDDGAKTVTIDEVRVNR